MPLDAPVLQFQYESVASTGQPVVSLTGSGGLQALAVADFPVSAGTLCIWIKTTSTDAAALLFDYQSPSAGPVFTVANPANLEVSFGGDSSGATSVAVNDGLWHRLVVTFARTNATHYAVGVYLDGTALFQTVGFSSTNTLVPGGNFYVGWNGTAGTDLVALVSELQVWSRVLTPNEILSETLRRGLSGAPGLVLRWPLDVAPPGNPTAVIAPSTLSFYTDAAVFKWSSVASATSYELLAGSSDGFWNVDSPGITTTSASLPNPPLGLKLGAKVRAFQGDAAGAWSALVEVQALELGQTVVTSTWTASDSSLVASWPEVPQRSSYTLELYEGSASTPAVTPGYGQTTYSLTSKVDDPSSWLLNVRAFYGGSFGPAEASIPRTAPALNVVYVLSANEVRASWTSAGAAEPAVQYNRFRIVPADGTTPYAAMLPGATNQVVVTSAEYPLATGKSYSIEVRQIGEGAIGTWATQTIEPHTVTAPGLSWTYDQGQDILTAVWAAVATGAVYDVRIMKNQDPTPVAHTDGTPNLTFVMTPYVDQANFYQVLVQANDGGVLGPANVPVAPAALAPSLVYDVTSRTLIATWTTAQTDAYLRLFKDAETVPVQTAMATGTDAFSAPLATYPEGTQATLHAQGLTPGYLAAIETATATVHDITAPVPTLAYASGVLTLSWAAVNPSLTIDYQLQPWLDGQAQAVVDVGANLSKDVTSYLADAVSVVLDVRGTTADHSIGPWSTGTVVPGVSGLGLTYDEAATTLTAAWTLPTSGGNPVALSAVCAELWISGGTLIARQWLSGTASQTSFSVSSYGGQSVTVKIRTVQANALSAVAQMAISLADVVGPVITSVTDSTSPNQIHVQWSFNASGVTGTVLGFDLELQTGGATILTGQAGGSATEYTFSETGGVQFQIGTTYSVVARARVQPVASQVILGSWSQAGQITFGVGNLSLATLSATSDTEGNITVSWSVGTQFSGQSFELQMNSPTPVNLTGLTNTSKILSQSSTGVVDGATYTVQVRASLPSGAQGAWSQVTVVANRTDHPGGGGETGGDPVFLFSGAFGYTNVDLMVPGVMALQFAVYYQSDRPLPTDDPGLPSVPMGARWSHAYNTRIVAAGDGSQVAVLWGDLAIVSYTPPPSRTGWCSQKGIPDGSTLFVDSSLNYTLTTKDQTVYFFNPSGQLLSIQSPAGNQIRLAYSGAQLHTVSDIASGNVLTFAYDGGGRISSVSSNTGASIAYQFDGSGNLTRYDDPNGGSRTFAYDGQSRMLSYTDALNNVALRNTYGSDHRVSFQQDARAIKDGESYGTTFAYATSGSNLIVTLTDRNGAVTVYTFNQQSQLLASQVLNLGGGLVQSKAYTYDGNANVLTLTQFEGDPASGITGNVWRYAYDGVNNVIQATDPLGNVTRQTFNALNLLTSVTDVYGNTTTLEYQGCLLTKITEPLGKITTFTYKSGAIGGLIATSTDAYGDVTQLDYDGQGRLISVTDPTGALVSMTYDGYGWPASRSVGPSANPLYRLGLTPNAMGWNTRSSETYQGQPAAEAFVTSFVYDGNGSLTALTNPANAETRYAYDPDLQLTQITYPPDGGSSGQRSYVYDREENVISVDDGASVVWVYTRDPAGRISTATDPNGNVTRYSYAMVAGAPGSFNLVQTATLPINAPGTSTPIATQIAFDPLGRAVSKTDCAGGVTAYAYANVQVGGAGGLQITTTLPKTDPGQTTPYTLVDVYDALGRLVSRTDQSSNTVAYAYAPASTLPNPGTAVGAVTQTTPTGVVTQSLYDPRGRLVEVRRNPGTEQRSTVVVYDALDRITQVTQASQGVSNVTTLAYAYLAGAIQTTVDVSGLGGPKFSYNPMGALVSSLDASGQSVTYGYTPSGLMASFTDARGEVLNYAYDAAGRLTGIDIVGQSWNLVHTLDANGNRLQSSLNGAVQITRTFDPLDRLLTRTDAQLGTVTKAYNAYGTVSSLGYPGGKSVDYGYDGLARLIRVTDWANRASTYAYYPTGQLQSAAGPNGVSTQYTVDADGRLTGLTNKIGALIASSATYAYNPFNEVQSIQEIAPSVYAPSAVSQSFTYANTRLTQAGGVDISYDADGDMTSLPSVTGPLTYDAFRSLTQAGALSFAFDVDGLRTGVTQGGATDQYVVDPQAYVNPWIEQPDYPLEYFADLQMPMGALARMPAAPPMPGTPGVFTDPLSALDRVLSRTSGGATAWFVHGNGLVGMEGAGGYLTHLFDGQGNTLGLVDTNGALVARHGYDLFGSLVSGDPLSQPFGYVGQYGVVSDSADLAYMRVRTYVPSLMRFTSQDFLFGFPQDPQTTNRYLYLGNDPALMTDPLGMDSSSKWGWIIGGAVGLGVLVLAGIGIAIAFAPGALTTIGGGLVSAGGATGLGGLTTAGRSLLSRAGRLRAGRGGPRGNTRGVERGTDIELRNLIRPGTETPTANGTLRYRGTPAQRSGSFSSLSSEGDGLLSEQSPFSGLR